MFIWLRLKTVKFVYRYIHGKIYVHCPCLFVYTAVIYWCPLSRYMGCMYNLDAFTTSCPADQDIISHYKMQQVISHRIKKILKEWYDIKLKHSRLSFRGIYSLKNHYTLRKKLWIFSTEFDVWLHTFFCRENIFVFIFSKKLFYKFDKPKFQFHIFARWLDFKNHLM